MFRAVRILALAALASGLGFATFAQAQAVTQPVMTIADGTLIAPGSVDSDFSAPPSGDFDTVPSTRDPLVQELARSLNYDIDQIFTHVRDHVEFTPMYGMQKGERGAILDGYGTALDQAELMVDLLREADSVKSAGYNPAYIQGTVQMSGADFASWFGVDTSANFTQLLADGGIPGSVTGSGGSATVTVSHFWVKATIGGTAYYFDPGRKGHTTATNVRSSLSSWMVGCSASDLMAGAGTLSPNTSAEAKGFDFTGFNNKLNTCRANLESEIKDPANGVVGEKVDDLVGASYIVAHPATENRRTQATMTSAGYSTPGTSGTQTWAGQVANIYRTKFTVSMSNASGVVLTTGGQTGFTYYADKQYGIPEVFNYNTVTSTDSWGRDSDVLAGKVEFTASPDILDCDWYRDGAHATAHSIVANVFIDHPYPASYNHSTKIGYLDRTISKQVSWRKCSSSRGSSIIAAGRFVVTNDWGDIGKGAIDLMRREGDPTHYNRRKELSFEPTLQTVAAQYSRYLDLAGHVLQGRYQLHDLIGVHQIDNVAQNLQTAIPGGGVVLGTPSLAQALTMDFEGAVSANQSNSGGAGLASLDRVAVGGIGIAESAVSRDEADGVRDTTSLTLMASLPTTQSYYVVNSGTNWTSGLNLKTSLTSYQYADGGRPFDEVIQPYITAGYSVLIPQNGQLSEAPFTAPSGAPSGAYRYVDLLDTAGYNDNGVSQPYTALVRSSFYVFNPTTGAGAVIVYDPRRRRATKGGIEIAVTDRNSSVVRPPDAPKAESKNVGFSNISIDGKTGDLTYAPPVDLSDGAGAFPQSLSLQRRYQASDRTDYGFGVGWKSNWQQAVSLQSDGFAALGDSGGFGAASAIVTIKSIDALTANGTPTNVSQILGSLAAQKWLADQTQNNVATVSSGVDGEVDFFRQADDPLHPTNPPTYAAASPDGGKLTQTGLPTDSLLNRRIYDQLGFSYTDGEGGARTYQYVLNSGESPDYWEPFNTGKLTRKSLYLSTWAFPDDTVVTATFDHADVPYDLVRLKKVINNFGAELDYDSSLAGDFNGHSCDANGNPVFNPYPGYIKYKNTANTIVTFDKSASYGAPYSNCVHEGGSGGAESGSAPATLTDYVDEVSNTWAYGYGLPSTADTTYPMDYGPSNRVGPQRLTTITKPSTTVAATVALGQDGTSVSVTDARSKAYAYLSSPFRSERDTPLLKKAVTLYDQFGRSVSTTDPNGLTTTYEYDSRDRVTKTTMPESDSISVTYDTRSNPLFKTHNPKSGCAAPENCTPLSTSAHYPEDGATRSGDAIECADPAVCNKPDLITDARGTTTKYAWDDNGTGHHDTGNLLQIDRGWTGSPLVCNLGTNNCPRTVYAYAQQTSPVSGGGSIWLIDTATASIDSGSVVTKFNWASDSSTSNNLAVTTVVGDYGGTARTTTYAYDVLGNITSVSDPRSNATTYGWYADRTLKTVTRPDPDGAATQPNNDPSLDRPQMFYVYTVDGQVDTENRATVDGSGGNYAANHRIQYTYDAAGNILTKAVFLGSTTFNLTQYSYDDDGRVSCETQRLDDPNATPPSSACSLSPPTSTSKDRIKQFTYDDGGRVLSIYRGLSTQSGYRLEAAYTYYDNGTVKTLTDGANNLTKRFYDSFDRMDEMDYPSVTRGAGASDPTNEETFGYDANGNLTSFSKRESTSSAPVVLTYDYDVLNRQIGKHVPASPTAAAYDIRYDYDRLGRKCHARLTSSTSALACGTAAGSTGLDFVFNKTGQLTSETGYIPAVGATQTVSYLVDANGNRTAITWPASAGGGRVDYDYDTVNRVTRIYEHGAADPSLGMLAKYSYDASGRRTEAQYGNGTDEDWNYDAGDRLTKIKLDADTAHDLTLDFTYNAANQVLTRTDNNAAYAFDSFAASDNFTYDGMNRDARITALVPNGKDCSKTAAYGYDCNGNLVLNDSTGRKFAYDEENRLTGGTMGLYTDALTYDAAGRLQVLDENQALIYTSTQFLYAGDRVIADYGIGGAIQDRYVPGPGTDEVALHYDYAGARHWLYADNQGSTIAEAPNSGTVSQVYAYGAYGEPDVSTGAAGWTGERFRYTGQMTIPTLQLYHYKARAYDPAWGHFLQTDPIGYASGDLDLYAYVGDDPVNKADPTGLLEESCNIICIAKKAKRAKKPVDIREPKIGPGPSPLGKLLEFLGVVQAAEFIKDETEKRVKIPVYRVYDGDKSPKFGVYWSIEDPRKMKNWRDRLAIYPVWNKGTSVVQGYVTYNDLESGRVLPGDGPGSTALAQPKSDKYGGGPYRGGGNEIKIPNAESVVKGATSTPFN